VICGFGGSGYGMALRFACDRLAGKA